MLTKYKKDLNGKLVKVADVYTRADHHLKLSLFDDEAVAICRKLQDAGFEAYIVGGAVRDLLLGITPKDFDIATNAHPAKVKKLFKSARVIGKRFKLVHIPGRDQKLFEVVTFRSSTVEEANVYGSLDEDAFRRDFTLNALYYNPVEEKIIDFHQGVVHLRQHQVEAVVPLDYSFEEDPVRMIRAMKYARTTASKLSNEIKSALRKNARRLGSCSTSRLSEELIKILNNKEAENILKDCYESSLLKYWLPNLYSYLSRLNKNDREHYWQPLKTLSEKEDKSRGRMVFALLSPYVRATTTIHADSADEIFNTMRLALTPLVLPNRDLIEATQLLFAEEGLPWSFKLDGEVHRKSGRRGQFPRRRVKKADQKK